MLERRLANDGIWYAESEFKKFYPGNDFTEWWSNAPRESERRIDFATGQSHDAQWFYKKNENIGGTAWSRNRRSLWDEATPAVTGMPLIPIPSMPIPSAPPMMGNNTYGGIGMGGGVSTGVPSYNVSNSTCGAGMGMGMGMSMGSNTTGSYKYTSNSTNTMSGGCSGLNRRLADDGKWWNQTEFMQFYPGQPERWDNAPREEERRIDSNTGMCHDAQWFYNKNSTEGGSQWTKNYKPRWQEAQPMASYVPSNPSPPVVNSSTSTFHIGMPGLGFHMRM